MDNVVSRALEYFAYACKQQLFWDGNKRTSTLIANKLLIEGGAGVLIIDKEHAEQFNICLNDWYVNDKKSELIKCLSECIKTINFADGL